MENLDDVVKIMGVNEETIKVYSKIKFEKNLLNPLGNELLNIFRILNLSDRYTVLDIPCGQGGVSVHLAKKYGVTVDGYDLLEAFIGNANEYAAEHGVQNLCRFHVDDIRTVVEKGKEYDLVVWSAPPHLWESYRQTIENLRKCVKSGGHIVIADAYLYDAKMKAAVPDYEMLDETLQSATALGDIIVKHIDYKGTLWAENYRTDREAVTRAINNCDNQREEAVLKKHLEDISRGEQTDKEYLGLFLLVMQVRK